MTKMISVRDDVYALLSGLKAGRESFSELFIRLAEKGKPSQRDRLLEMAGAWEDFPEMDGIFAEILKRRGSRRKRVVL